MASGCTPAGGPWITTGPRPRPPPPGAPTGAAPRPAPPCCANTSAVSRSTLLHAVSAIRTMNVDRARTRFDLMVPPLDWPPPSTCCARGRPLARIIHCGRRNVVRRAVNVGTTSRERHSVALLVPVSFDLQPVLTGNLIELRPLREEDFAVLHAAASDPLIWEQHPESDRWTEPVF